MCTDWVRESPDIMSGPFVSIAKYRRIGLIAFPAYLFNPQGGLGAGAYFQDTPTAGEWMHVVACFDSGDATRPGQAFIFTRTE